VSDGKKETLSLSRRPARVELRKTVETGQVKQSFSHGRQKVVQVEVVRKKRPFGRPGEPERIEETVTAAPPAPQPAAPPPPAAAAPPPERAAPPPPAPEPVRDIPLRPAAPRVRHILPTLSDKEKASRLKALEQATKADLEARRRAEDEARRRAAEEARLAVEREAAERRRREEEARKRVEEEAKRQAEEQARRVAEAEARARGEELPPEPAPAADSAAKPRTEVTRVPPPQPATRLRVVEEEEGARLKRAAGKAKAPPVKRTDQNRRRSGRITVTQALSDEQEQRMRSLASVRRERERRRQQMRQADLPEKVLREVIIPETITVQELANRMAERATDVTRTLMGMGVMASLHQSIDADTAELVVTEMGHRSKRVSAADVEIGIEGEADTEVELLQRPPVVTVMGHVDHGKTSLLDAIREADVVSGEAGGITQHIGAYQVTTRSGERITFIDTPGHAAFTAMRARGAKVTDIVILVVAADDGVMPQTVEAIHHARAAGVPIIVAVNKIDKPDANPTRVKQELLQHEVVAEDFGGDVQVVEVSALKKTGLDKLEEAILLQSEVLELKANPERAASGVVIEAKLDRGRGSVATVLVQRGTLLVGDVFISGREWGRVRAMNDSNGRPLEEAGPSMPVEVLGAAGTPLAGDDFLVVAEENKAREVAAYRQRVERDKRTAAGTRSTLDEMFNRIQSGEQKELPIVFKTDVQGSLEAIVAAAEKLSNDEVSVRVLHAGVGAITESDVQLARASGGAIIGFNVRANAQARDGARRDGVDIRYYSIIYELVDDLKALLSGLLAPQIKETVIGTAELLEVFNITNVGRVAGCRVTSGVARRNAKVRLIRDNVVVHDGVLKTLKRFKDDVREVRDGNECGIAMENYQDIQQGDHLEFYEVEEVQRVIG